MKNVEQEEYNIIQEAVFQYARKLRRQAQELRCFLGTLKEIGCYSSQADTVRDDIERVERKIAMCQVILKW